MKQPAIGDSLRRDDMRGDTQVSRKARRVTRYTINVNGRWSARLYTASRAKRALRLASRLGFDAYLSPMKLNLSAAESRSR